MEKEYIKLQSAYVTQLTTEAEGKSEWIVMDKDGNKLYELPGNLDEHQVMACIHFARKFELDAFNAGINFWKEKTQKQIENMNKNYNNAVSFLKEENARLAYILEDAIVNGNNDI